MTDTSNSKTLQSCLFKNCYSRKTGTVFITTADNRSCQIVLTNGVITALYLRKILGIKAVLELAKVGFKNCSFTENLQYPLTEDAKIDSSDDVLKFLGYTKTEVPQKIFINN